MSRVHYYELMEKIEEHEGKQYLMIDDCMLHKVLGKIKKILIDIDDKLLDHITLKNALILMIFVIKDDGKFYPQLYSEEAFYEKQT